MTPPDDDRDDAPFDPEQPEEGEEDFERMLEASFDAVSFAEGQTVEGRIVSLGKDVAFVDVGGKGEATIDLEELVDPDGALDVEVGDIVQGVVVSTAGGVKLSHRLARRAATLEQLEQAWRARLPVEGRVERAIKGGFEVRIAGQRAFCPISQIDAGFTDDPSVHEGQVYEFRIAEFRSGGKNVVVSRRALLEEEQRARAEEVRRTLVPGAVVSGRVVSVRSYGAFVDLGGAIQGLLHVSEMAWSRVEDPSRIVRPGDEITVQVLGVDEERGRISLGLKQLQADPWTGAARSYQPGQVLPGRVTRVAEFGAFVELEPGVEALAHASTFAPSGRRDGWRETVIAGAPVTVEILAVEAERKRISVAVVPEGSSRAVAAQAPIGPGARVTGKVERHERYGFFVFLAPGRSGLVPAEESGLERGESLEAAFPPGSDVELIVLEADESGRRIRLSRKALLYAEQRREAREFTRREDAAQRGGFGSLADKLRDAMRRPEEK